MEQYKQLKNEKPSRSGTYKAVYHNHSYILLLGKRKLQNF